jgi:L,D-peptidoglycan transpeptidase YkuD (ErfK/YbiS/YcfS/YnhG family)
LAALVWYLILIMIVVASGYSMFVYATEKPPVEEIEKARTKLAAAKGKMAGKYAGASLKDAEDYFEQAMEEWKRQNNTFFVFRDYSRTTELALNSYQRSITALEEAGKSRNKLRYNAETRLENLSHRIAYFEKYYKNLALNPSTIKIFSTGKNKFAEARIEFKAEEYLNAQKHVLKAEEAISKAEKQAHLKLAEFYRNYPLWEKNTKMAIQLSKKGQTVFLIDKLDAKLIILKAGKEYKTFPVEFGDNWMMDKIKSGDNATPEGIYNVQVKKERSNTKYYKALLLDYPNKEDQKTFNLLVRSGKIPKNSRIGGLIEIHGEGGRGINWTEGCIALDNKEMDVVYSQCNINTPVIIVGARKSLEEYLNQG